MQASQKAFATWKSSKPYIENLRSVRTHTIEGPFSSEGLIPTIW